LVSAMVALKRAQRMAAARQKADPAAGSNGTVNPQSETSDPAAKTGFKVSAINLEKTAGSSLVHAVGTVNNTTARQRFGVTVEVDLFDVSGKKVGTAKDYHPTMEPTSQWRFKALVVDSKATSAKLASIKDDQ
jgi:hypothetical protein